MIEKLMNRIESHEFAALLNVASSFKVFCRAAYKEQVTKELIEQLRNNPANIWLVLKRSVDISQKEIDSQYENPWDTAMAVYLWSLSLINLEVAQTASGFVIQAANGWWSAKFANFLLQHEKISHRANFEKYTMFEPTNKISVYQTKYEMERTTKYLYVTAEQKIVAQPSLTGKNKRYKSSKISVINMTP
ncbi:hypothetical protein [Argonema galeatum]|uniref:hypothetical protein n=1 Tax=Argonema galeatum TaxID=2942762 RepID=UPI0020132D25|nr:hypothetical protein [Argonema galeatum]MCL1464532.1 hypothetical protein [Argonema galeatum A003/A1]